MCWDGGGPFCAVVAGWRVCEFEECGAAPGVDDPVWGFEVLFAAEGAEGFEVLRLEEEGVGELVAVNEEG